MIINLILAMLIFTCYVLWEFGKFKSINKYLKWFVDLSPIIIFIFNISIPSFIFLILCLIANFVIFKKQTLGGVIFILAYGFASIYSVWGIDLNVVKFIMSFIIVLLIEIPFLFLYKDNKIGILIYGFTSSLSCIYAFMITMNFGFLSLVIGDTLLIVNEIHYNKKVFIISDFFYFLGTCLVPLSLI